MNDIEYALNITMNESISKTHPLLPYYSIYELYLFKPNVNYDNSFQYTQAGDWDPLYALTLLYNER